jgi:hypothetical protein
MPDAATKAPPAPNGADAVAEVAEKRDPGQAVKANALAYFMGQAPPPGRDKRILLDVDFGPLGEPNLQRCVFRPLSNDELMKCDDLAESTNGTGEKQRDIFKRWSYVYAFACVDPDLGEALTARGGPGGEFSDTAALVREVFRFQAGVLGQVVYYIERYSRTAIDSDTAVREVEAGKGSS